MIIIKIGGGQEINIKGIAQDLLEIKENFIIVHGANYFRDQLAEKLNTPKKVLTSVSGYSSIFSDSSAIDLLMMAYSGYKNKRIVEVFQRQGLNAVGLSGIDGKLIQGKRNQGIRVRENDKVKIIHDFSGKPTSVNKELLEMLLEKNYIPILTAPIIDEEGYAINSENDDIVSLIANEMGSEKIIQLIEAPGIMLNLDDAEPIKTLSLSELEKLENKNSGRMKRKILSIKKLLQSSNIQIIISDGRIENPIKTALSGGGTLIK